MAIQLAAEMAPKGARQAGRPDARPPPGPARRRAAKVDSHTVRKHSTWRHSPEATASMAATTAPPGPGSSPPPLIQVGWRRRASSTAVTPPSLIPIPAGPG